MIEFGIAAALGSVALFVVCMIEPVRAWLDAVASHREAQAASVLHYAGLYTETGEADT